MLKSRRPTGCRRPERWRQQFGDERPSFRIGNTREITLRLVEQNVNFVARFELGIDELAVYFDVIAFGICLRAKLFNDFSINSHTARNNQLFRVPARGNACRGDKFLQTLFHT